MNYKKALYYVLILVFVYLLGSYWDEVSRIKNLSLSSLVLISALVLLYLLLLGLKVKLLMKMYDINLKAAEWFGLSSVNTLLNYVFVNSGVAFKAVYMKAKHKMKYSDYLISTIVSYIIGFFSVVLFGTVASIIAFSFFKMASLYHIILIYSAILLVPVFSFSIIKKISRKSLAKKQRLVQLLDVVSDGQIIKNNLKIVLQLMALELILSLIYALRLKVLSDSLGYNFEFWKFLLISPLSSSTVFLSFVPGALGIKEGAAVVAGKFVGIGVEKIVAITVMDRGISVLIVLASGMYFYHLLGKGLLFKGRKEE